VKDPLAIGLGALACGTGFGGGTIVATLVIVRTLEHHASGPGTQESAADPVLVGTLAGLAVGAAFGWYRGRSLDSVWQRGVIGVLSAVGALLVAFLAWPIDHLLGIPGRIPGLAAWGVASFVLGGAGSAWSVRGSRDDALKEPE